MKISIILTVLTTFLLVSCNQQTVPTAKLQGGSSGSCSGEVAASGNSGALFKIGDTMVERKDLPKQLQQHDYDNEHQAYQKNLGAFKELALRIHLAKAQGKLTDIKELPPIAELIKVGSSTEIDAKTFFEQNKSKMPPDADFEKMKAQIIQYMDRQKIGQVFQTKMADLESKGLFTSFIAAPLAPELKLNTKDFPVTGDLNAKVKIVEISDYLCGHCQSAHPKVKNILEQYKGKISFTQINFSLRPSGLSGTYARGAYCAQSKGADYFWKYHHAAFEKASVPHDHSAKGHAHNDQDGNSKESIEKVTSVAKTIGLDAKEFEKCINGETSKNYVQKTNKYISESGINSTPVFIVNNKKLAQGVFELEQAIKKALN